MSEAAAKADEEDSSSLTLSVPTQATDSVTFTAVIRTQSHSPERPAAFSDHVITDAGHVATGLSEFTPQSQQLGPPQSPLGDSRLDTHSTVTAELDQIISSFNQENHFQVTIHALIPSLMWNWQNYSHLQLWHRGNQKVNSWIQIPLHDATYQHNDKCNAVEVTMTVNLPLDFLGRKISYTYAVNYHQKSPGVWEHLYDFPGNFHFSRCLDFSAQHSTNTKPKESCHIYDGFIFPPETHLDRIQRYAKSTGIHTKNSWSYAMSVFLHQVKVLETEEDKFDIYAVCENVIEIYHHMKQKKFIPSKGKDESLDEIVLTIGVQMWIHDVITRLTSRQHANQIWGAKVVIALAIIMSRTDLPWLQEPGDLKVVLNYLSLDKSLCCSVVGKIDDTLRLEAINGIEHIFKLSMITDEKLGSPYWEWLALVPLYHQLQSQTGGICVSQDTDPQNPNWFTIGIDEKKLKEFRNYAQSKRLIKKLFTELHSHLKDDKLLLRLLVYLSSEDDAETVLDHAPTHVYAIHISQICCETYHILTKEKRGKLCNAVAKLLQSTVKCVEPDIFRYIMDAVNKMLCKLFNICKNTLDDTAVLFVTIELYLCALSGYFKFSQVVSRDVQETITDVQILVMKWIQKPTLFFGECFGGKNGENAKNEIQLWDGFLKLADSDHISSCIQQEWKLQIQHLIKERVYHDHMKVPDKIKLAMEVCDYANNYKLDSIICDISFKAVANVMENDAEIEETRKTLATQKKEPLGAMLSTLLMKYYAKKDDELSTTLSFCLWPQYLRHYLTHDGLANEYSNDVILRCRRACVSIQDVSRRLEEGKVAIHELKSLTSHQETVINLFPQVVCGNQMNAESIKTLIYKRNSEVDSFKKYCSAVRLLLQYCEDIAGGEHVDRLKDGLKTIDSEEYLELKIVQLCEVVNGIEVHRILCVNEQEVMDMLHPFSFIMEESKSVISSTIWNHHITSKTVKDVKLSLCDIATKLWAPCLKEIQGIIEKFHDRSVTLQELDYYLKEISLENLESEVLALVEGCNKCFNLTAPTTWVFQFVMSVDKYRVVCQAECAAELVLNVKEALMLTGDFKKLENFQEKIIEHKTMSLEKFKEDGYYVEEVECLQEILSSNDRMDFLRVLSNSYPIIAWLRQETNDATELRNLIELSTFEDNVCAMDRIARLHTVGAQIAPLVYDLKENSDFDAFMKICEAVWLVLKANKSLAKSLEECCQDLPFFRQIKGLRMPVETGTYEQVKAIMEGGECCIGSKVHFTLLRVEEVVKIKTKGAKHSYTLIDLKELESRVVLIRDHSNLAMDTPDIADTTEIAGDHSAAIGGKLMSKDVEKFLNMLHFIVHISDTLICLQRAGNPQYVVWFESFACNLVKDDDLKCLNEKLKNDLQEWVATVSGLRKTIYPLNYFTCLQLLKISGEFYDLVSNSEYQLSKEVLLLLMSISPDLTIEDIRSVMSSSDAHRLVSKSINISSSLPTQNEDPSIVGGVDEEVLKLTEEEKTIFIAATTIYEFKPHLVLAALRCHGADVDEDSVVDWCYHNSSVEDEYITETPKIDGDNLTVKELIEYDFPKQLAIKAVEECGEDVVKCMDYCTQFILEKKNRHDESLSETSDTSLSRSNSVENVALDFCEKLNYIDIKGTGELLNLLMRKVQSSTVPISRLFANCFEKGAPNLVIVSPCDVLNAVISLYVHDMHSPLPSLEEVLICNHKTTVEELSLFWYKAVGDPDHRRIFCLVNGEKLSYQVCTEALDEMDRVLKGETDYRLVVVCGSKHKEEKSYIIDHLQLFRRDASAVIAKDNVISRYLQQNMKATSYNKQIFASDVDPDKCCARIVRSERSGMGKSLYISRIEEALQRKLDMSTEHPIRITIPIHGPDVDFDVVMTCLQDHLSNIDPTNPLPQIFHFDIAPSALNNAGALIFSMLVLKGFSDSSGKVWRCFKQQLYIIEATYAINIQNSDWNNSNNTYNFLKFIPTVTCCSPREAMVKQDDKHGMIYGDTEMLSSEQYQRPYQYLSRLTDHTVTLDRYSYTQMLGNNADFHELLHIVIRNFSDCDVHDPSWMEFRNFLYFLNAQLEDCENSAFCKVEIERDLPGFKTFVVQFMLKMAKDFAVPSLNIAMKHAQLVGKDLLPYLPGVSHPNIPSDLLSRWLVERMSSDVPDDTEDHTIIEQLQCHPSRVWDRNFHPYIFFNQDHDSLTFIGFSITENGDLIDPVSWNVLIRGIVSPKLSRNLRAQGVGVYGHNSDRQRTLLEELFKVIGIDTEMLSKSPDDSYVLTPDNAKKILAILMRFRCNIPVILMGETGCGKTRLIKYMCELLSLSSPHSNILLTLEVHGGVSEKDVVKKIHEAQKLARKNEKDGLETVLFFDEANTSKAIGLIKEVMCDKRVMGRPIKENIKFIAACNPYRRHSENMIKKLERAGLGYHVKSEDTEQKLGDVPLRNLVYRVLDIPSSMCSLVYDFGQLNSETEKEYTLIIVRKYVERDLSYDAHEVTSVLTACQEYMRSRTDECSFVSLRDIERAMIVLEWFNFILPEIEKDPLYQTDDVLQRCNRQTRALILSIAVCYYAKLQCREEFEEFIISQLYSALYMPMHDDEIFKKEVILCQEVVLNNMKLPPNIARNGALRENVFMMVVCIELKIPLFLVGKPGSSKSLAKSIVADAMQGAASRSPLFRKLKQIQLFSYQCSQHSTSESILEVFKSAAKFQEKKESQSSVSVVVLDEVGLAEDSPALPLKALHPLLEDGTAGTGDNSERVAFVGISNWALDPAKMNRGIMVTRDDPGVNELVLSARGICCSSDKENACEILETFFEPFATVYMKIYREQTENAAKEFFGLRDFYSLIKMMYGITQRTGKSLTMNQLQHCLKRNFGGTNGVNEIVERFLKSIPASLIRTEHYASDVESYPCDSYELIKTSLQLKDRSWNGETRYVLFLTENYSALRILQQTDLLDHDPLILFGSSFPEDVSYTQVCRNINQIKFCMDTGRTVILLNLEHLYESLYDLLNQYYITLSDRRYVDLGLQSHRIKCRVHPNFKLVLIANKDKVYEEFPTPLINRLEKHYLVISKILSTKQETLVKKIEIWVDDYLRVVSPITIDAGKFAAGDSFVGYQLDTPASIAFKVCQEIEDTKLNVGIQWEKEALSISRKCLLQLATPDSIARSKLSKLSVDWENLFTEYFKIHSYSSLDGLLKSCLSHSSGEGLVVQITTHGSLLQRKDLMILQKSINFEVHQISFFSLQQFKTEMEFCNKIRSVFRRVSHDDHLIIIQCDSGYKYIDLIACARYRVLDEKIQASHLNRITHVVFIIGLPRSKGGTKFVGFQGGRWDSYHVDSLLPPKDLFFTVEEALHTPVNKLLLDCCNHNAELFLKRLQHCSSPTHLLKSKTGSVDQAIERSNVLSQCFIAVDHVSKDSQGLPKDFPQQLSVANQDNFRKALLQHMIKYFKSKEKFQLHSRKQPWAIKEALNAEALHENGSFINALVLKIDNVIAAALNNILDIVDRYCNIRLLITEKHTITTMWLKIFEEAKIVDVTLETVSDVDISFQCQFPFFWLLIDNIESQWKISTIERSIDVYTILKSKSIAKILLDIDDSDNAFKCYLHDFILFFSGFTQDDDAAEVFQQAVNCELEKISQDEDDSNIENKLLYKIILLHEAYRKIENQLQRLKQIMILNPAISSRLPAYFDKTESDIDVGLYGVQELLTIVKPDFKEREKSPNKCRQWLSTIHNCENTIDATISAAASAVQGSSTIKQIRRNWQMLKVLQIFLEHTLDYIPAKAIQCAAVMHRQLQRDNDFSKFEVYDRIKKRINMYASDETIVSKFRDQARDSCDQLFMEIISEVIFAVSSASAMNDPPEEKLVSKLIETVLPSTGPTQEVSALKDNLPDTIPVIRSYVLQILLEYNMDQVKVYLQQYFTKSCDIIQNDMDFCVLCIQCFEDSFLKKARQGSFIDALQLAIESLEFGIRYICTDTPDFMSLNYVESVAKVRYSLVLVGKVLHDYYLNSMSLSKLSQNEIKNVDRLLNSVQRMCFTIEENANQHELLVVDFLVKNIVRKYGISTLVSVYHSKEIADFSWVIPKHLRQSQSEDNEGTMVDPFVIYGKRYTDLRDSITTSLEEEEITAFQMFNPTPDDNVQVLLILLRTISLGYLNNLQDDVSQSFDVEVLENLKENIQLSIFDTDTELTQIATQLIYNFKECPCPLLTIMQGQSLSDQQIHAIVVHTAVVVMCSDNPILSPLKHFVKSSATLQDMYIPSMPHDELFEHAEVTRRAGRIYKCKYGHPYVVTECGNPVETRQCEVCGEPIGGSYKLAEGNTEYKGEDSTETGHLLGPASHLGKQATPERDLSPLSCTILRLIIHAAFTWTSVCVTDSTEILTRVVHPSVTPEHLPQFFWEHVVHDVEVIAEVQGISIDDAYLITHLVLNEMHNHPKLGSYCDLLSKESRKEWERKFDTLYILPVINKLTSKLQSAQDLLISDNRQVHSTLLQTVYEKNSDDNPSTAMWRYRPYITVEHVKLFIERQKDKGKCPMLKEYLTQEIKLRATQYLPDIIQLQQFLFKRYNYNLDEEEASQLTVEDLLSEEGSKLKEMVESFYKAWTLVNPFLTKYGAKAIPKELVMEIPDNALKIPLVYVIPTTTGKGVCSTRLVDFLVTTHNNFIDFYHESSKIEPSKQTVPLKNLQKCYLVADEQQVMSVVMSHCHYSLTRGKGTEINYDLPALERHFRNRCVHGRPLFDLNTACVVIQHKNLHTSENFAAVRRNISPQKTVESETKRAIVEELSDSTKLREVLETINTVLTILANLTTNDDPKKPLGKYTEEVLRYKLPPKTGDCTIDNMISLWETLAVEQAKRAVSDNQDPFKDISNNFKKELQLSAEEECTFYASLNRFHTDQLLGSLYQFIVIYIRDCPLHNQDWPLIDTFPPFLEKEELDVPGLGDLVKGSMPKSITLCHVVDTFKKIVKSEAIKRSTN